MRRSLVLASCLAAAALAATPRDPGATTITRKAACQLRFQALCAVMHRCSTGAEDLGGEGCEAIDPGCEGLQGPAPASRQAVEACVAGLRQLTCRERVDPSDAMRFEQGIAACAAIDAADQR